VVIKYEIAKGIETKVFLR